MLIRGIKIGEDSIDAIVEIHGPHRLAVGPVFCSKAIWPDAATMGIDYECSIVHLANSFVTKMDVGLVRVKTDHPIAISAR